VEPSRLKCHDERMSSTNKLREAIWERREDVNDCQSPGKPLENERTFHVGKVANIRETWTEFLILNQSFAGG